MLDIERMRKEVINRSLLGSYCEEYTYFYDSRTIKFEKSGYLIGTDPNSRITADNDLDNQSYNGEYPYQIWTTMSSYLGMSY